MIQSFYMMRLPPVSCQVRTPQQGLLTFPEWQTILYNTLKFRETRVVRSIALDSTGVMHTKVPWPCTLCSAAQATQARIQCSLNYLKEAWARNPRQRIQYSGGQRLGGQFIGIDPYMTIEIPKTTLMSNHPLTRPQKASSDPQMSLAGVYSLIACQPPTTLQASSSGCMSMPLPCNMPLHKFKSVAGAPTKHFEDWQFSHGLN